MCAKKDAAPQISVIVPTYQEAENLPQLTRLLDQALTDADLDAELIIADDDSRDDTATLCHRLNPELKLSLRLLTRTGKRSLSFAVIDGIALAQGEFLVVMDADLSHPPEKVPQLVAVLKRGEADFVIGSRYVADGKLDHHWGMLRRFNSYVATLIARPLVPISDPMSGFFALRKSDMPRREMLFPIGYKIGLEIAVKGNFPPERMRELPIYFRDRKHGESKLALREQINYVRHLRRLYHYRWPRLMEVSQFCLVGGLGLLIDISCYYAFQAAGIPHLQARALAFFPAVTNNWFWNRIMTFKTRRRDVAARQWLKFFLISIVGFTFNWGTYALLTEGAGWLADAKLIALLTGVFVGTGWNFIMSDQFVFRRLRRKG